MPQFARVLDAYRRGNLSRDQVLAEAGFHVSQGWIQPPELLALLERAHAKLEVPTELRDAIVECVHRTKPGEPRPDIDASSIEPHDDETVTVLIGQDPHPDPDADPDVDPGAGTRDAEPDAFMEHAARATIGTVLLGRFKLVEHAGEGGMSRVFKAIDLRKMEARAVDPFIAVKLLTLPFRNRQRSLAVLQREAHKLQSLSHPNIVRVFDCDRDDRHVFMTMEYLAGEPLKRRLRSPDFHALPEVARLRIIERIASALTYAHEHRIVHGDLKPGNVIVTNDEDVKVIDFGIARFATAPSESGTEVSDAEHVEGVSFAYASPERLQGRPADPRDDIYALACIAHEIMTGEHPFGRKASVIARNEGLALTRRPGLSAPRFKALVRALAFERHERTPTVQAFSEEFGLANAAAAVALGASRPSTRWVIAGGLLALSIAAGVWFVGREGAEAPVAGAAVSFSPGDMFRDCATCPLMRVVPAGQFEQGTNEDESDATVFEQPRHAVRIARPFALGLYEVTVREFEEFAAATDRDMTGCTTYDGEWRQQDDASWRSPGMPQTAAHPVVCVSWNDARDYTEWLTRTTGKPYRLPSASEWEYAARGGESAARSNAALSGAARPWSEGGACQQANVADATAAGRYPGWSVHDCDDGNVLAAAVGSYAAGSFGLHDLFGNVFEWTQDCWHDDYEGAPTDGSAWVDSGDCASRELRGGSWFTSPEYVRSAYRNRFDSDYRSSAVGFRIVRELE